MKIFTLITSRSYLALTLILFFSFDIFSAAHNKKRTIHTLASANASLHSIISNFPTKGIDAALATYKKERSDDLLQSAKVLYDAASKQILEALAEIDGRITYWQYQKDHPWNYFVSKNPLKWLIGPAQEDEVENNLETLKSHQGELYVFLGQLGQLGSDFNAGYKDIFLADYEQGYAWIDKLLDALTRIKTKKQIANDGSFIARARQLQEKLENVSQFKDQLLSDIPETAIPPYVARNWFKGGMALLAIGYGYAHYDPISIALLSYAERTKNYLKETAMPVKEVFFPSSPADRALFIQNANVEEARSGMKNFLEKIYKQGIISEDEKKMAIEDELKGNSAVFQKILNEKIISSKWYAANYGVEGWNIFLQLLSVHGGSHLEKEIVGLRNIALLAPAALITVAGYSVLSKIYQRFIVSDFRAIKNALIDINSLFVDPTHQLTDEARGKMTYLIYMLKKRAKKELPAKKNLRDNFIHDLERIESSSFNVAAKRAIIEDMFRKYEFLGLIQKK